MRPEDIINRDFLVGLRGYDKDEVRQFLVEIADAHGAVLAELEQARYAASSAVATEVTPTPAPAPAGDDFENLGASVAAIIRQAKASADELKAEAQAQIAADRHAADADIDRANEEAAVIRADARAQLEQARAEAERLVTEATERCRQIQIEHDARMANREEEFARREANARQRLTEATEELQLALLALGGEVPSVDLRREPAGVVETNGREAEHSY